MPIEPSTGESVEHQGGDIQSFNELTEEEIERLNKKYCLEVKYKSVR